MENVYQNSYPGFLSYNNVATPVENDNQNVSLDINEGGDLTLTDISISNLNNSLNTNEIIGILQEWGMPHIFDRLTKAGIGTLNSFKFMTERDLDMIFPCNEMENKIMFRKCVVEWRILNGIKNPTSLDCSENMIFLKENSRPSTSSDFSSGFSFDGDDQNSPRNSPSPMGFDLKEYLNNDGSNIKKAANENKGGLSGVCRDTLTQDIVRHYVNRNMFMHEDDFNKLAEGICKFFPLESKGTYYFKDSKNMPCGKLYYAYKNTVAKLRKGNLFPREKKRKIEQRKNTLSSHQPGTTTPSDDKIWLKYHSEPWPVVEEKWKATVNERKAELNSWDQTNITTLLAEWPAYMKENGQRLIDIDFDSQFTGRINKLHEKWGDFVVKIIPYFKRNIKDKQSLELLKRLQNPDLNVDARDILIVKLFHAICPPVGVVNSKDKSRRWKFSISDSQRFSLLEVASFANYKVAIEEIKNRLLNFNLTLQPILLIVGDVEKDIEGIYCIYDSILYKFDNFIEAVSVTFKIHYVFNLKYQVQSKVFWTFIQVYFFEIDEKCLPTSISTLIPFLKL